MRVVGVMLYISHDCQGNKRGGSEQRRSQEATARPSLAVRRIEVYELEFVTKPTRTITMLD
ncbi:hypothetical protein BAUCODRAFT_180468 [Baudoinia panamericana UAMH 10762]|uniref:Uncharacterized protein n=1 Tax=Baudoinia panamericana (strain UAMH 10762) TaxID=717646 RepID=M2NMF9_BAUPA|nr:uncharacterized protein BAUCODRAFT_180468 [Baudoinia panamericana UAMH 10762]EMD00705.1 hypothetical protein BAUCODRAFT_180468 [Baudoinia panamericana UAMH 10762]